MDVPPLSIYLAPDTVTDPTDSRAKLFGTVPAIAAGTTPTGNVQLTSDADWASSDAVDTAVSVARYLLGDPPGQ